MSIPSPEIPALLGGPPVRPHGPPDWPGRDAEVLAALQAALADGSWGKYHGGHVEALEAALAERHAVEHALACASGTLAIEVALRVLGVEPGDEVILAAYDYGGNFLSVHAVEALPVLVDVAVDTGQLDPSLLAEAVGPRTKAVIASHLHGGLVPMRELMEAARGLNLKVVEDAAQAAGAWVQSRPAGSWGDVGVLSFGGSKLLTAGRGGALVTRQAEVAQRARVWLSRGPQHWAALSELQAVALRPQLARLDEYTRRRAAAVRALIESIGGVPGLTPLAPIPDEADPENRPAYYKLGFRFDADRFGLERERFVAAVRAEGVAFDEGFRALHVGRAGNRLRRGGDLTAADRLHCEVVTLHHPVLLGSPDDLAEVARAVRKTYLNADRLRG
jgi:dTDP-4-amino-4,6-dideoxygalactose transaminase